MYYHELMSLPTKWDDTVQYKKITISNVLPLGFSYVLVPLVIHNEKVYYALSSSPAKGVSPDSNPDWMFFCDQSLNLKEFKETKKKDN